MEWVLLFAGMTLVGALVLGAISLWLWRKVRKLGREVRRASDRLTKARGEFAAVAAVAEEHQPGEGRLT